MKTKLLTLLVALFVSVSVQAADPPVKKSISGICHDTKSSYYTQTKNFTPFNTIDECLKSGGRLPKK
ncbi:MAG: hypothetical protein JHD24_11315 [Polynucleobacter sp.]|jgi:hypothetical protein|nr:hypothetical protein [Polynucleobacter sp.]